MLDIIYEDRDVVVVNKPAGLQVHHAPQDDPSQLTLVDWLIEKYPEVKNVGDVLTNKDGVVVDSNTQRPGIVHRLDRDTSGVMIVAKTQPAFEFLKNEFQSHHVAKTYLALVFGKVREREGVIDSPIGTSTHDFRKRSSSGNLRGKIREAVTEYKVREYYPGYTLVEAYPKTGRTHQIRVHMKHLGYPIVGDALYGPKGRETPPGVVRQMLHALAIEVALPSGERSRFEAGLPSDFTAVIGHLAEVRDNVLE